ncbi:hypothetical protein IV203_023305 [Nitzschia inconspicua]|uniref:BED-type domain-containing protein n=1 Tax=Nitzschia inconspicua TaxID=303405 RepID=A0A9K3PDR9_9STRA|nr:hypothetical protein IV203_023305 [Nitzschia inconspicua]
MSSNKISGKELVAAFFHRETPNGSVWLCRCGKKCKQKGSGYTNLVSHITRSHHEDYLELRAKHVKGMKGVPKITDSFWPQKTQKLHCWISLIVDGLLPFSFCENEMARKYMKHGSIARNTLMKYMCNLSEIVENKIAETLPLKFALVFYGWSSDDNTHYVALFATYPDPTKEHRYSKVLLSMSPMRDGDNLTAQEHHAFITDILGVYRKTWANVVCLIGDNCSTNIATATEASLPLKLKNIIPAANLRKLTPLRAKCSNATRWSSTYEMLVRYKQLEEFLPKLGLVEVEDMMPNHSQKLTIDLLMSILSDLQSVTKALQAENRTVLDVRDLFDEVIKTYPQTKNRLGENASIIHDNVVESAVQKILKGSEEELTPDESVKVIGLRHESSTMEEETRTGEERDADAGLSLAEKALKRRRLVSTTTSKSAFMDLHFIVPTSNMCERLFSEAGYGLNSRRMRTLQSNFETQMFLRTNKTFWGMADINRIVTQEKDDENNDTCS